MQNVLIASICLLFAGCATMPGSISERTSGFDNTKEIVMEPAWLQNGFNTNIKIGLYKTSKMDKEKVILTAVVIGAFNFSDKGSLMFNIDGDKITLESIDSTTNIQFIPGEYNSVASISGYNESSKRYEITKDLIKRMIEGKEVWVKINLSQQYVEGKFSVDDPMSARPAFRNFYNKAWKKE